MKYEKDCNLSEDRIDPDTLALLVMSFRMYNISKMDRNIYRKDNDASIAKQLIIQYYRMVQPNYKFMIYSFRKKYISNELLVEKNDTPDDRKGMKLVYDFIQDFNTDDNYFNVFTTALRIHSLLYRPADDKYEEDDAEYIKRAQELEAEAKREKNLAKYKEAREMLSSRKAAHTRFGGVLRTTTAVMHDFNHEVPTPQEVLVGMNAFLTPEKKEEFQTQLENPNIIEYINYVVDLTADLIGMQPFPDGNKRTFRSLLNLMFKLKNLPPVYIVKKERVVYHQALEKAIRDKDYRELEMFYYYKICDSIYELDFEPFLKIHANSKNPILEATKLLPDTINSSEEDSVKPNGTPKL